jgi:thymidylate kinase
VSDSDLGRFARNAQFEISGMPLALVFAADRHLQYENIMRPHLQTGGIVIADRYILTAVALDGVAAGIGASSIFDLYRHLPAPVLTFRVERSDPDRRDTLEMKDLLQRYETDWHVALEDERRAYDEAEEFLRSCQGWAFERLQSSVHRPAVEQVTEIAERVLSVAQ